MSDLHAACRQGDLALISSLLAQQPESINERDSNLGWAPLYRSVICNHEAAVKLLLKQGADPDMTYALGETALHYAADNGYFEIGKELVKAGANPNVQQKAASRGDAAFVALLLDAKANPNLSNLTFGRIPLHYAVENRCDEVVKLLIQHGSSPFIKDKVRSTQRGKKSMDLAISADMKQLLFLQTPRRTLSQSSASSSPIFNVTPEQMDSIPPISQLAFEKLSLSPSSSCSEILTTASRDPKPQDLPSHPKRVKSSFQISLAAIDQRDSPVEPEEERLNITEQQLKERTFSFGKGGDKKTLYNWLAMYSLESLCDLLVESGYDDVEQMVAQMKTHMPITTERLRSIGVPKPGHATRLLAALELELKAHPSLRTSKSSTRLKCCVSPKATPSLRMYPSLSQWLEELGLGMLYLKFIEAGYEDVEPLLAVMKSSYSITEDDLRSDFHIEKPGHRHRILSKLHEDSLQFDPFLRPYGSLKGAPVANKGREEEETRSVSCELCRTM